MAAPKYIRVAGVLYRRREKADLPKFIRYAGRLYRLGGDWDWPGDPPKEKPKVKPDYSELVHAFTQIAEAIKEQIPKVREIMAP